MVTATDPGPYAWVQVASVDNGPGIPDIPAAMADGYSTINSLGGGLGACRRAAGAFDVYAGGTGTVVLARIGPGSRTGDQAAGQALAPRSAASFRPSPARTRAATAGLPGGTRTA